MKVVAAAAIIMVAAFPIACSAQPAKLGTIDFPTSGSPAAQPHFIRGVLFLHSFEYESAAAEFREAQRLESGFAMAYWGEAMTYTHPVWNQQDVAGARAVLNRLASTAEARKAKARTHREQMYLAAVESLYGDGSKARRDTLYAAAMQQLVSTHPDDMEAQAFYALSLLGLNQGVRDVPTYMRAAAIVEPIFEKNPDHPGAAHYIIHAYDDPAHAPKGLRAARAYSKIAPGAAHAQHMTTHIFLAMGMWDDVVSQNEIAVGHDHDTWTANHYTVWLNYAYLQQGRYARAREMVEMLRQHAGAKPPVQQLWGLAEMRAHYVIDTEDWGSPIATWSIDRLSLGDEGRGYWAFVSGYAAMKRGDAATAVASLKTLSEMNTSDKSDDEAPNDILELELKAVMRLRDGAGDEAVTLMREATKRADALPVDFGPPSIVKPPHELFGDILLELGHAKEAQSEFLKALELAPKRARSLLGLARASAAAGDSKSARRAWSELRAIWHGADAAQLAMAANGTSD
jgi:tetratricopeptide (TPR) repeat protein